DEVLVQTLEHAPSDLGALIEDRAARLIEYQDAAYATRYRTALAPVVARETELLGSPGRLSRAAAEGLFRVMAYKDEYEVARMHIAASYGKRPVFHMAPPLITRTDPATGRRRKMAIPGWAALPLFRLLRHGKRVRGTALDLFGQQAERRQERALVGQYEADLRQITAGMRSDNLDIAVALAEIPDLIRGFGPVKEANRAKAMVRRESLLEELRTRHLQPVAVAAE
ncbi:MAG TPA: DUF6537 domain-containing protein, partial [Acetobacteraceae bacterium]